MKRGKQIDTWYPFYIDKWLFGSTRHELIINPGWGEKFPNLVSVIPESVLNLPFADLRGVFTDLMTISKKDGGFIRANATTPYPLEQLAGMWCVPLDWLKATIAICLHPSVGKLTEPFPGIYYVVSTETYSLSDRYKRGVGKAEHGSEIPEQPSGKEAPRLKENRGEKNKKKTYPDDFDNEDVRLTELLIELMGKNNPSSSILRRMAKDGRAKWADVVRKLREIDRRTPAEIEDVIRFSQEDEFWSSNILSMPTLRDKWDKLVMKARRGQAGRWEDRVGAHPPETSAQKEINRRIAEFTKKAWADARPELEAARKKGAEEYRRVSGQVEARISDGRVKIYQAGTERSDQ